MPRWSGGVTLLGPSGCGKTTTLRMIAGYIVPDAGTIHVDGKLLSSPGAVVPPDQRGMGMVFQNYAVWPHKTVYENVVFGLKIRKTPAAALKKKLEETLALVNLTGLEGRYPNELSGGQQQRVALARSLVVEPEILLLDEPLSNLDAKLRENMRVELKRLQRRTGITFVYVTHDQAEALALSDQIAVIHGGKLQQYGSPQEVYARPSNRVVADFMGLVNLVPGKVRDRSGAGGTVEIAPELAVKVDTLDGFAPGDAVEVAIRPESIRIAAPATGGMPATIANHVFLGNISEYYVTLPSGLTLRVQTHPTQQLKVGEACTVEVDATLCTVFRAGSGEAKAA